MFERYTEKARRVIFFARYEASQFGSPYIETEHLLLGLLREDKALTNRFLRSHASVESIRKQIEGHTTIREKVSTSVDLPLSNECKRVLAMRLKKQSACPINILVRNTCCLGSCVKKSVSRLKFCTSADCACSPSGKSLPGRHRRRLRPRQRNRESSLLASSRAT